MNAELNGKIVNNARCCGESGTFAVTRPDVSTQVRFRKAQEIARAPMPCAPTASPATSRC